MAEKLVNRIDILNNLINTVAPRYFPQDTLDQFRTSIFGYLTESESKSIEDTITLEQRRAIDYCPELSNSAIKVRQTAKIRGVTVIRAEPGQAFAILGILKSDILEKGTKKNNEVQFTIDRRSTIVHDGIPFSLEDDIIIRAVRRPSGYIYAANYSGEHSTYESYIQMFEQIDSLGQDMIMMLVQIYQCNYNIQEKVVTDLVSFTYDGLSFDYDNLLADFEVYYRRTASEEYTKLELDHYLTTETTRAIYYNDDDDNILYIMNNPALNIGANAMIRVEMKETLGTEGMITLGAGTTSFSLYRDESYNYAGINITISMLSDTVDAQNGDQLSDIKKRLIDAKTRRDNITTEHDVISYINDIDANIQVIKKRNDIEDRRVYMYTLLRKDRVIAPANTKKLWLKGVQNILDLGDFDQYDQLIDRKILRAYNKFKLVIPEGYPDVEEYLVKVDRSEQEEGAYYFTCPFMILVNDLNLSTYFFTSVSEAVLVNRKDVTSMFPFNIITRGLGFTRDSHNPDVFDQYFITCAGTLNTSTDTDLVNDDGTLKDPDCIRGYVVFRVDNTPVAYLPLSIESYEPQSREFTFAGVMRTNDFITEEDKLQITEGLYKNGTNVRYNSVIDYHDACFDLYFFYKYDDAAGDFPRDDIAYQYIPKELTDGYVCANGYYNKSYNPYNLIMEFSKFTSSFTDVQPYSDTTLQYTIHEVPVMEYEYGIANIATMYDTFKNMVEVYTSLLKLTTDFDISLKFIATYGPSKYLWASGGRNADGEEDVVNIQNLNPTFYFKVYGQGAPVDEIRQFIYEYLRDTYITSQRIFISNICTLVEQSFSKVDSIKYMGIDNLNGSYQEFNYIPPEFVNRDVIYRFVPEQLNVTNIIIELDEE